MDTIKGNFADAIVYASDIEDYARYQIQTICDNDISLGSRIRIMPDCHPGKIGPVGLTMTVTNKVIPQLMGIDIGGDVFIVGRISRNAKYLKRTAAKKWRKQKYCEESFADKGSTYKKDYDIPWTLL